MQHIYDPIGVELLRPGGGRGTTSLFIDQSQMQLQLDLATIRKDDH